MNKYLPVAFAASAVVLSACSVSSPASESEVEEKIDTILTSEDPFSYSGKDIVLLENEGIVHIYEVSSKAEGGEAPDLCVSFSSFSFPRDPALRTASKIREKCASDLSVQPQ